MERLWIPDHGYPRGMTNQTIDYPGRTGDMRDEPDHGEESYVGHDRLAGKVAVVTGGDSGIGRAVCIAYAREGADLVVSYLPEEQEDAEEVARLVRDAGREVELVPGDLRREEQCKALVDRAVERFGRVDVLVSNAAHQMAQQGGIADITTEQLTRTVETNIYAMFWLCRYALPHMPAGGAIITTSSIQATTPSPQLLDYATTKGAIVTFTQGLAQQVGEQGIRVNSVAPGPVWTPLIPATMPEEKVESFGTDSPVGGRPGQPAELAPAFVFLASDESSFVSGEVLSVTGGKPF